MGVKNNECVIATTWDLDSMKRIKEWVHTLSRDEQVMFAFVESFWNRKETVFLGPDGAKKDSEGNEPGDWLRKHLIDFIKTFDYEDGSNPFDWVEVGYGEFGQKVLQGNNVNCYTDDDYCDGGDRLTSDNVSKIEALTESSKMLDS